MKTVTVFSHQTPATEAGKQGSRGPEEQNMNHTHSSASHPSGNSDAGQYRRVYITCFIIFLFITLLGRMLPQQWRVWQTEPGVRKSILQETREQAGTFVPYVFMNH